MILKGKGSVTIQQGICLLAGLGFLLACHWVQDPSQSIQQAPPTLENSHQQLEDPSTELTQLLCQARELGMLRFDLADSLIHLDKDSIGYSLLMKRGDLLRQQSEELAVRIKQVQKVYYLYWGIHSTLAHADSLLVVMVREQCPESYSSSWEQ